MNNRFYYAHSEDDLPSILKGSRASDDMPLVVNCAGSLETAFPFQTDNPRGREDYYLMIVLQGSLQVRMPNQEPIATPGTLLLFPPHYHYRYTYTATDEPLHYLWIHFSGSHVLDYLERLDLTPLPLMQACRAPQKAIALFEDIFNCFSKGTALRDSWLSCHLETLLLTLSAVEERELPHQVLARSLHYIEGHYTEDLSIPVLAAMENLSYSRYHDVFTSVLGISPKRYIIRKRLDHACRLLLDTDMSIGQIGAQVGYADPCFFAKLFKKELGCTPLSYRNKK